MILYIYSLLIQSYLTSLIPTSSTLSAACAIWICPFARRTQTSFLPLRYWLQHSSACMCCDHHVFTVPNCLAVSFRFLPFLLPPRGTQLDATTYFPTHFLRASGFTKRAAFVQAQRARLCHNTHCVRDHVRKESFPLPDFSGISHHSSLWSLYASQLAISLKCKQK